MPFHRPQRIIKPFVHFENTSGPGQRFSRSTRSPRRGVIVSETQPPSNTQGSEGTLRDDVIDVHRTSNQSRTCCWISGLSRRPQGDPSPSKTNRRQLGGHSAHKGGKHSPRRRHQGTTPLSSLPRGVLAGLASFGFIRNKRQSLYGLSNLSGPLVVTLHHLHLRVSTSVSYNLLQGSSVPGSERPGRMEENRHYHRKHVSYSTDT